MTPSLTNLGSHWIIPSPGLTSLPADMMATRSQSRSASSRKCVVSMMEHVEARLRITSQVNRRLYGSMPLVGSSRGQGRYARCGRRCEVRCEEI
jgi:hypothetical protein